MIKINHPLPDVHYEVGGIGSIDMKRDEDIEYSLAREQHELALSQAPGEPKIQAIHREMARLHGEFAREESPAPLQIDTSIVNRSC